MISVFLTLARFLVSLFKFQSALAIEVASLQHQIMVLKRSVRRPKINNSDRIFWVVLRKLWPDWRRSLIIVQPQTVINWHRQGFRLYWRWKSRPKDGRPQIDPEIRKLIRMMWLSNPTWGSPRIRDELAKIGISVSDSTVRKYKPLIRKPPSQTWLAFLRNHMKQTVAIDFFIVPTIGFRLLYLFIILSHDRRKVLYFNVTESPSAKWTGQQIINAFPYDTAPKYLLRDNDGIYGTDFVRRVNSMNIDQVKTAYKSPWQNPFVERFGGSIQRECLDHVIIFNEDHLRRVVIAYLSYYHNYRTHLGLDGDCPEHRPIEPPEIGEVMELPMVVGLHHRYTRRAA